MFSGLLRYVKQLRVSLVLFAIFIYFLYNSLSGYIIGEKVIQTAEREQAIKVKLIDDPSPILGEVCDSAGVCFNVVQRYRYTKSGDVEASRHLCFKEREHYDLTGVEMVTPKRLTKYHLNPLNWRVNHRVLIGRYNALQAAAGFFMESLTLTDRNVEQNVLQLGMGGGTTTNFLAVIPVNLHIDVVELEESIYRAAKDFFELTESARVQVFIQDGVKYIDKAAQDGLTYRSILLDACDNDVLLPVMCPAPPFLEDPVLSQMSQVVGDAGVISVNVFVTKHDVGLIQGVLKKFQKHFKTCFLLALRVDSMMLFCSNMDNWDYEHEKPRFLRNLEIFDQRFKTDLAATIERLNE